MVKKIYRNILDENGKFTYNEDGSLAIEIVEREDTPEEVQDSIKNAMELEFNQCLSYLESTKWVYDKQRDLGLTDEQLRLKHGDILDERLAKRVRMQELQELGVDV